MIHGLVGATIVTPDLDAAIGAYRDYLGYRGAPPECVGAARASAWGAPEAVGARMVELYPESGEHRFIRLVEGKPAPGFKALTSLGWTAIELVVQDLATVAARLADSPFTIIGMPAVLDLDFTDQITAMQVSGPGGEVLYLTQIDGAIPGFDLPDARAMVGQMFIMVLAASSLDAGAAPYVARGGAMGPALAARINILSSAFGLPKDHKHSLTTVELDEQSFLEIDVFPPSATPRPTSGIGLPSGIAMVTLAVDARARSHVEVGASGEWIEFVCFDRENNKKL